MMNNNGFFCSQKYIQLKLVLNSIKEAFSFAQARSLLKSAAWFGIAFDEIEDLLKGYYNEPLKANITWSIIKSDLLYFYKSCNA